jgi:small subunit ribosomal protein S4e
MGKRGRKGHTKRIAAAKAVPVHDKKKKGRVWIANTRAGAHGARKGVPLVVLLREVLGVAENAKEAKIILGDRKVLVDGVARTDHRFPVGYMDIVSMPAAEEYYRIGIRRGKLVPEKVGKEETGVKLLKVTGKRTLAGNKTGISLHDGRNIEADNNVKVHKFGTGAKCMITDGKHSGTSVVVEEIYPNEEGRPAEALVRPASEKGGSFRTLAGYLFVVGE